ncbi:MAG: thioredoxin family protein [Solirubrobacteraceae bacterium]|nr:thioredoxin family protein [Solirubrobacteraceae bacterium]
MSTVTDLTTETFADAIKEPGLTVVDFWAPWCGPCRQMAPQFEKAAALRPDYRFTKVNIDDEPALAQAFEVRSIPTLAVIKDGQLLGMAPGAVAADQLIEALDRVAA